MNQDFSYEFAAVVPTVVAAGLCVSLCTIRMPDGLLVDAGQPSGTYVDVPGLVDIPCVAPPMNEARLQATEIKALEEIQAFSPKHVWLSGYFPQLDPGPGVEQGWIAVIDGNVYDIMGAEPDSQKQMTRMGVRLSGM
jgi:hypothetical protein